MSSLVKLNSTFHPIIFFYSILYLSKYDIPELRNLSYSVSVFNDIIIELNTISGIRFRQNININDDYYSLKRYVENQIGETIVNKDTSTEYFVSTISFHLEKKNNRKIYIVGNENKCLMAIFGLINPESEPLTVNFIVSILPKPPIHYSKIQRKNYVG